MERKQTIKYILLDTLSAMLAWGLLFLFRKIYLEHTDFHDTANLFGDNNLWFGLIIVPLGWLALYTIMGTYRNVLRKARLKELLDTLLATIIGVVAIFFLLLIDDQTSTYMIGSGAKALHTYLDLENQETYSGNLFMGYVRLDTESATPNTELSKVMPCLGSADQLRDIVEQHGIQEVIIALEDNQKQLTAELLRTLNTCTDLIIKITPDARDLIVGSVKQDSIFHSPFIVINNRLMPEWQYSVKRIADIALSLLAMTLLSPVYLVTAIIVKTTSPGPVFYAQERIGYHGRPFRMHKFRSMYIDAEDAGPALSKDDDPRITPFGRFMRKVRLDEIPQFYNVLKGTMSIVGPRPERQFYIDQIVKRAPEYLLLQRVKPGITSWGQVKYGYASNVDEMVERLRYDLLYIDNMSLIMDMKIMVYTAKIIIQGRGK